MSTTFEHLSHLLLSSSNVANERLKPDAPLQAIGIDSLGTAGGLWKVEEAFRIRLTNETAELQILAEVARFIDKLVDLATTTPVLQPKRPVLTASSLQ